MEQSICLYYNFYRKSKSGMVDYKSGAKDMLILSFLQQSPNLARLCTKVRQSICFYYHFYRKSKSSMVVYKSGANNTYRIGGYRTPLLIRTPRDIFWAHNGHFWQFFIQNYYIFGLKIAKNDHCEQSKIGKNK